ncbi:enoyl-CoA hydratase-related protein [Streptomyces sp. NPDC002680]|uniref:enoyl-CoA hydratase-related protein n=1 Tax=Streptomyces sp. NPDC002680 TaxID=3364659 RepID=UPI00369D7ED0
MPGRAGPARGRHRGHPLGLLPGTADDIAGIVPDIGVTWALARHAGRARAMGMSLLGDRITAEQARDWG